MSDESDEDEREVIELQAESGAFAKVALHVTSEALRLYVAMDAPANDNTVKRLQVAYRELHAAVYGKEPS